MSVAALAIGIAFLMASETGFWSAAAHLAHERVGVLSGVMNTAGIAGGILSTLLVPVLVAHFGWLAAFGSGAAMSFGYVLAWLAIREAKPALPVPVTMADGERR